MKQFIGIPCACALLAIGLAACASTPSSENPVPAPSARSSGTPVASVDAPAEPEVAPWDDPTCYFEKKDIQLAPEELVQAFLRRSTSGDFLHRDKWLDLAVTCPGHLGGPDGFNVIRFYKVLSKKVTKKKAVFNVRIERIGTIAAGGPNGDLNTFQSDHRKETVEFEAVKTPYGWKLSTFLWQDVLVRAALTNLVSKDRAWVKGDRAKFEKAVEASKR